MIAISRGMDCRFDSGEAHVVSTKARENDEIYGKRTAKNTASAVDRRRTPRVESRFCNGSYRYLRVFGVVGGYTRLAVYAYQRVRS